MNLTFQADDPAVRYSVLKEVGRRWGAATRLVLQEFVANALEHCPDHRVDLEVHPGGLVAMDYGGGYRCPRVIKPEGEGGYGLQLIRGFGGSVSCWECGMKLEYRFPADCDDMTSDFEPVRRSLKSRLASLTGSSRR